MGRYQKKPYKKHSVNHLSEIDLEAEYFDVTNIKEDDIFFEESLIDEFEDTSFFEEPEIVKQLRKDEIEGRLNPPLFLNVEENEHIEETNTLPKIDSKSGITYDESLKIARKTFSNIRNKKCNSILFVNDKK